VQEEPVFVFPGPPPRRWRGWRLLLLPPYILFGGVLILTRMSIGILLDIIRTPLGAIAIFVGVVALLAYLLGAG
jgi:hypothetical protein